MFKSILQNDYRCYVCGKMWDLHIHHIFGGARRKISDKNGCMVYLCAEHHTGKRGVHSCRELDLSLKRLCEEEFVKMYGKESFMRLFGKSYIDKEEEKDEKQSELF